MEQVLAGKKTSGIHLHRQRGASLLEGIAYLGIAALVILGAVSLLTNAFGNAQSNRAIEELVSIRTAVKKLYMGQPGGYVANSDLTATLVSARVFPGSLTINGNAVSNSWGGSVSVTGNGSTFTITYAGIPRSDCINIISSASGWIRIDQNALNPITTFPVSTADAATTCSVTGAGGNTLNFEST